MDKCAWLKSFYSVVIVMVVIYLNDISRKMDPYLKALCCYWCLLIEWMNDYRTYLSQHNMKMVSHFVVVVVILPHSLQHYMLETKNILFKLFQQSSCQDLVLSVLSSLGSYSNLLTEPQSMNLSFSSFKCWMTCPNHKIWLKLEFFQVREMFLLANNIIKVAIM